SQELGAAVRRDSQRLGRCQLAGEPLDVRLEQRIQGDQAVRLEDLRLRCQAVAAEPVGPCAKLVRLALERRQRARLLELVPAEGAVVGLRRVEQSDAADGDAGSGGQAAQLASAHGDAAWACSRAAMINAVEVAPGSWCPMLRSPRYDARPFDAWSGVVARMPSSHAARAAVSAAPMSPPPSSCERNVCTAGASASTIVLSPSCAAPSSTTPASAASSATTSSGP